MALQPSIAHHRGLDVLMIAIRLLDDAHAVWEAAEQESHHALHAWFADRHLRDPYLAYRAALDREEAAARDLERLCELTQPLHELLGGDERRASNWQPRIDVEGTRADYANCHTKLSVSRILPAAGPSLTRRQNVLTGILQPSHLLIMLIVAFLIPGPTKLSAAGRAVCQGFGGFKRSINGAN